MKIKSVTLRNFRCFGDNAVTVEFSEDLTGLVGANGSGKTALLVALTRLFGITQDMRTIRRSDFHVPHGASDDDLSATDMLIETVVVFPELSGSPETSSSVAPVFRHMILDAPGAEPYCRLRLEAKWTDDGTIEGHIDQDLHWVLTSEEPISDDFKRRVMPADRGRIQVFYIPANRDPAPELRSAARNRAGRLVNAISWVEETRETVQDASDKIRDTLRSEQAVNAINDLLQERWQALRDDYASANARLSFGESTFDEIVRNVGVVFPEDDGKERDLSALSEGQQSLFYLALVAAVFDIESQLVSPPIGGNGSAATLSVGDESSADASERTDSGFRADRFKTVPDLVIFALEEPENHLAPHYLARILQMLRSLTKTQRAQAIFSSHSPSVLRLVFPEEVRHLRLDMPDRTTMVKKIVLPSSVEEANKYVREAILAYPELYFAKFVILAEGDSEQIVLPKIASAKNLNIDESFVSVVPLGGRHVNHFWRLLSNLEIPYVTLLDLDLGRQTGGWTRIKYVCEQLLRIGVSGDDLLTVDPEGKSVRLSDDDLNGLHKKRLVDFAEIRPWLEHLEKFGVYFSIPLDLDLAMLFAFGDAYKGIDHLQGPVIPTTESSDREDYLRNAIGSAVGNYESGLEFYSRLGAERKELFAWYRYLFLSRSKPAIHIQALAGLDPSELHEKTPKSITQLFNRCREVVSRSEVD